MRNLSKMLAVFCLLLSTCAGAQSGDKPRKIVLPNAQLIHCRSAQCSQLWKQESQDGDAIYPSQVLTDVVNGEVVGLTAVYDESASTKELEATVNAGFGEWSLGGPAWCWRVVPDQIAIQLSQREDGTKQLIYLKFVPYKSSGSLVPSAHIYSGESGNGLGLGAALALIFGAVLTTRYWRSILGVFKDRKAVKLPKPVARPAVEGI